MKQAQIHKTEVLTVNVESAADLKQYREAGWAVDHYDDMELVGFCEACGSPLFENSDCTCDDDGIYLCADCLE